jgi:DNA repair protein RadA/Sms
MAKQRVEFRCEECGASAPQWAGRCASCDAWNTMVEVPVLAIAAAPIAPAVGFGFEPASPIGDVRLGGVCAQSTGVSELDRVLGGGFVPGSVTLIAGEPGVGKSTLLTQVAASMAFARTDVLYVSAEESRQQVRLRAGRLNALAPRLWLASETELGHVLAQIDRVQPGVVIVDSVQTVHDPSLGSAPGSVVQVRECAHRLVREAKERDLAVILVGHVTKEGGIAGPRVLEHVVDTVLCFEGERHHALRLLRASKHRFGSTNELGVFEMTDCGLEPVPDASALFLADRQPGLAGSAVVPTLEGQRPLLVELQALVAKSTLPMPRRSAQGVDGGRLAFLLAVLESRASVKVSESDVFSLAVGGVKVTEPGADLALALAVTSSLCAVPLPGDLVACAEIGLGGELRQVGQTPRRLAEAVRLGFTGALLPQSAPDPPRGLRALRAGTVAEALRLVGLVDRGR